MNSNLINLKNLLFYWLYRQISPKALTWLEEKQTEISQGAIPQVFFLSFSAVPRHIGKENLKLTPDDWQVIEAVRPGWFPHNWTIAQTARTLLLLSIPHENPDYLPTLEKVFLRANVEELEALYQAIPLLPYPEQHRQRAAQAVGSNITAVFNAIALCNPYPAEYFDDMDWNQMVLKALSIGSPLHLISGLNKRANPQLSQILIDYTLERWGANRGVSPDIWQLIKP